MAPWVGVDITIFSHARDNIGTPLTPDWPAFVAWIEDVLGNDPAEAKTDLLSIGPYRLHGTRGLAGVEAVTIGALDLDHLENVDALREAMTGLGLEGVFHTTPSDTGAGPRRVRVFVPLSRPLAPWESKRFRLALAMCLGVETDPQTLHAAAIFFVGRTGPEPRELWATFGVPADVDALLGLVPADAAPERDDLPEPAGGAPEALLDALAAALETPWAEDGHQAWALEFMGFLAGKGFDREDRLALVERLGAEDSTRLAKYRDMAERARPLSGLGAGVREALGEALDAVDELVSTHPACPGSGYRAPEVKRAEYAPAIVARDLARAAVEAPGEPFPGLCVMQDITREIPPRDYWFPALCLDHGKISPVGAYAGGGKGPLMNLMAVCRAMGLPCLEAPTRQGHVLFLDAETGEEALRRVQRISAGLGVDIREVAERLHFGTLVSASPDMWITELSRAVDKWGPLLICLDSYTSAMFSVGGDSDLRAADSSKPEYAALAHKLGIFSRDSKCLVVPSMHARKEAGKALDLASLAGTNSLAAMCQTAVLLQRPGEDEYIHRVSCARAPAGRFDPFLLRWDGAEHEPMTCRVLHGEEAGNALPQVAKAKALTNDRQAAAKGILDVLRSSGAALPTKELVRASGLARTRAYALIRDMGAAGLIGEQAGHFHAKPMAPALVEAFLTGST